MYRGYGWYLEAKRRIEQIEHQARTGLPMGVLRKYSPTKRDVVLVLAVLGTLALLGLVLQLLGY